MAASMNSRGMTYIGDLK